MYLRSNELRLRIKSVLRSLTPHDDCHFPPKSKNWQTLGSGEVNRTQQQGHGKATALMGDIYTEQ